MGEQKGRQVNYVIGTFIGGNINEPSCICSQDAITMMDALLTEKKPTTGKFGLFSHLGLYELKQNTFLNFLCSVSLQ